MNKPWVSGPRELLDHAQTHLQMKTKSGFDNRIALISIDNAIEVAMRTFLALPKRIRGRNGPPRRRVQEAYSFPDLIDLLEEYANDLIIGVGFDDIEWFHRLRNQLYHDGNGLTVDPEQVETYLQIAILLVEQLFQIKLQPEEPQRKEGPAAVFIRRWADLEVRLRILGEKHLQKADRGGQPLQLGELVEKLEEKGIINSEFTKMFEHLASTRNGIAHGYGLSGMGAAHEHQGLSVLMGLLPDDTN